MVVCHCKAVSDCEVRRAVRAGASHRAEVTRACGAGAVCGGCHPVIEEIVAGEADDSALLGAFQGAPAR
jgi:bacterioferritin-associated ferredoxin